MRRRGAVIAAVFGALLACGKKETAPPSTAPLDRSCTTNDDCRPAPSCCPVPCTSDVIHRREIENAQRRVDATCTKERRAQCPVAGSCGEHLYACVRSQCTMLTPESPDWPRADATSEATAAASAPPPGSSPAPTAASGSAPQPPPAPPWDVSCKSDDDCVPVSPAGCCPTPCTRTVVNRRDHARVEAQLSDQCAKVRSGPCPSAGSCRGHAYLCVRSQCGIFFEGEPDYRARRPSSGL